MSAGKMAAQVAHGALELYANMTQDAATLEAVQLWMATGWDSYHDRTCQAFCIFTLEIFTVKTLLNDFQSTISVGQKGLIPRGSMFCWNHPTLTIFYMGNMFLRLKQSDRPIHLLLKNYTLYLAKRYILTGTTWDALNYISLTDRVFELPGHHALPSNAM